MSKLDPSADALAQFQARLLEILHAGESPAEMRAQMEAIAQSCGLQDYVHNWEAKMLVVASELVRKWAARASAPLAGD